jgi:uncharacterized membrane protein YedE/YeeE
VAPVFVSLLAGTLFGVGLAVSRMIDPAKVIGFLDVTGQWDPSLGLVMAGALLVTVPAFWWARRASGPLLGTAFRLPTRTGIDRRLVLGAVIFGVGWGLVGFCPGPALASLAMGGPTSLSFVGAMLAGTLVARGVSRERA